MTKKTIELAGEVFEIQKEIDKVYELPYLYKWDEIYSAYTCPSDTKVIIWHDWCKWADKMANEGYKLSITISSHTCIFFSISGSITFPNGRKAGIWITYAHNRIYFEKGV